MNVRHTAWCARDHRCNLGEHRAEPVVIAHPRVGRVLLTHVRAVDGREHAEVRVTVRLSADQASARFELLAMTQHFETLLERMA